LNPLQPNAMDVGRIAAEFGGKISFFGGIDTQITLISSDPDDVMREVLSRAESFSRFNGGYICAPSTSIMPETPISNIESMCKAISRLNAK
jgi:uroporphyrinogen decarboxylase